MSAESGSRKVNYAAMRFGGSRPTIEDMEAFVMLARAAEVPGEAPVLISNSKVSAEMVVEITPLFNEHVTEEEAV
jgi:hypothetical protein